MYGLHSRVVIYKKKIIKTQIVLLHIGIKYSKRTKSALAYEHMNYKYCSQSYVLM